MLFVHEKNARTMMQKLTNCTKLFSVYINFLPFFLIRMYCRIRYYRIIEATYKFSPWEGTRVIQTRAGGGPIFSLGTSLSSLSSTSLWTGSCSHEVFYSLKTWLSSQNYKFSIKSNGIPKKKILNIIVKWISQRLLLRKNKIHTWGKIWSKIFYDFNWLYFNMCRKFYAHKVLVIKLRKEKKIASSNFNRIMKNQADFTYVTSFWY